MSKLKAPPFACAALLFFGCNSMTQAADILDQGWNDTTLSNWHDLSQGSRILPLSWARALEEPASEERFMNDKTISAYGYTPYHPSYKGKRLTLPMGFVLDDSNDSKLSFTKLRWFYDQGTKEPWVGMNCSACHTAQINFEGQNLVINGGPTNADFQNFFKELRAALSTTASDPEKFERFAKHVLEDDLSKGNRQRLKKSLDSLNAFYAQNETLNATDLQYGPGRLDAVGHIFNKISQVTQAKPPTPNPSDAPVSYPFLWNTPQHDVLQWNGMVGKKTLLSIKKDGGLDVGGLGRNAGEAIGVYADIRPVKEPAKSGFVSSVNVKNLDVLERSLYTLKPPQWPGSLPKDLAPGAKLFTSNCAGCHAPLDRNDLTTAITAVMIPISASDHFNAQSPKDSTIGTDPWMACNAYQFKADAGVLAGYSKGGDPKETIQPNDLLYNMLGVTVLNTLIGKGRDVAELAFNGLLGIDTKPQKVPGFKDRALFGEIDEKALRLINCYRDSPKAPLLAYKARPLTGIWATAPYLHNGSVPTLNDLLLPPHQRPSSFYTGTNEFDNQKVGFKTEKSDKNWFLFNTKLVGNSNAGHDYGVGSLSDIQRSQLLDYLKSL
ncbi:di-heme-cytochrome C peroxidase [Pseudomonas cucumis]|uniref:Di-heme-cytochrome C peroxidase n=1 Tax=Pseudomonas cucumis TaxID=2954082 RepID=A0ABY9F2V7_9PSED|nr:di-heme-cytochrome C peroxidase [Pseudomonas cucumis]WLG87142.1 di-heme-cytochrome C peroxidase [Pseudomonas cucumis]WLG92829.1 di-heme-cytochrome C peroxidase [Pseudomonas cucumis]